MASMYSDSLDNLLYSANNSRSPAVTGGDRQSSDNNTDYSDIIDLLSNSVISQAQTGNSDYADMIRDYFDRSDTASAAAADRANEFTAEQNQLAMQFSASEAAKNREWQEKMSNTAHQREVEDLLAAGLNPILSVNAGASTPSGSTAQGFTGTGQKANVEQLFSQAMNSATQLKGFDTSLRQTQMQTSAQIQAASIAAAASRYLADAQKEASYWNALSSRLSSRYSADKSLEGVKYSSDNSISGTKYSSDNATKAAFLNALTSYGIAAFGKSKDKEMNDASLAQSDLNNRRNTYIESLIKLAYAPLGIGAAAVYNWQKSWFDNNKWRIGRLR